MDIDLNTIDEVEDVDTLREALRSSLKKASFGAQSLRETESQLIEAQKRIAAQREKTRCEEVEKNILASRLKEWEHKAAEIEGARKGFASLMGQISEFKEAATKARENMLCMQREKNEAENRARLAAIEKEAYAANIKEWEHKATEIEKARKNFLDIISKISGGVEAQEVMLRMSDAKVEAESKSRLAEVEKEAYAAKIKEWERKAEAVKTSIQKWLLSLL